jgi:hypothetical protein
MKETKEQILKRMEYTMPFQLPERIKPYILEAMQIYTDQQLAIQHVSGRSELLKCYHYDHEWKSDGQGGNLKYCNDCKCYV